MKETKISRTYFIENYKLKKDSNILILNEDETQIVINPNITNDTNKISLSDEEIDSLIAPLLNTARENGYFNGSTSPIELESDVRKYIIKEYNLYGALPSINSVKDYIILRNPSFAK